MQTSTWYGMYCTLVLTVQNYRFRQSMFNKTRLHRPIPLRSTQQTDAPPTHVFSFLWKEGLNAHRSLSVCAKPAGHNIVASVFCSANVPLSSIPSAPALRVPCLRLRERAWSARRRRRAWPSRSPEQPFAARLSVCLPGSACRLASGLAGLLLLI